MERMMDNLPSADDVRGILPKPEPRIETLKRKLAPGLDEVVARDVEMVHFEVMHDGLLWVGIYFEDGERLTLNIHGDDIEYDVGEVPAWLATEGAGDE